MKKLYIRLTIFVLLNGATILLVHNHYMTQISEQEERISALAKERKETQKELNLQSNILNNVQRMNKEIRQLRKEIKELDAMD